MLALAVKNSPSIGIYELRRSAPILCQKTFPYDVIHPVLGINNVHVISGIDGPSESNLPSQPIAHLVVLEVVYHEDPGVELVIECQSIQERLELTLRQTHSVPLSVKISDHSNEGAYP